MRKSARPMLLVALALVAADAPKAGPPKKGDKVRLVAADGEVPYFKNEADYRAFIALAKSPSPRSYGVIRGGYLKALFTVDSGTEAEVVDFDAAKAPSFATLQQPALVPPIVVKLDGREAASVARRHMTPADKKRALRLRALGY